MGSPCCALPGWARTSRVVRKLAEVTDRKPGRTDRNPERKREIIVNEIFSHRQGVFDGRAAE